MRVPYEWLLDYIDPGIPALDLAEKMTLAGVEVGAVERFGPTLPGVVVGQVKSLETHPGRNNLVLADADIGKQILKIVCGAKNMSIGDKVPVAVPGAELPGGKIIKEAELYGVTSSGMICSAHELGLEIGAEDEILILDDSAGSGESVDKLLGFDDFILWLEITPNRADCLSMYGVACETAALTGRPVSMPRLNPLQSDRDINEVIKISIADSDLCPRYSARVIDRIVIGSSPLWMQLRLLKAGIRPISNVVDITNYVMWEFGQPLHAFDLDLLNNGRIVVRRALKGEKLTTLDGIERNLDPEVLVITDGTQSVGLAGVMGGENTEINKDTSRVLIEAAGFNPTNIRRTARRYNLPSEASQRFEKGVNPEAVLWSQDRTALLINELIGGEVLRGTIDINKLPVTKTRVFVNPERVGTILGLDVPVKDMTTILSSLGFSVQIKGKNSLDVTVPLRRSDVTMEEDIVEEIARLYGYDKIPLSPLSGAVVENREAVEIKLQDLIKDLLTACGYYETINYSFINPAHLGRLRLPENDYRMKVIPVQNPFSEEQAIMRTTLLPGLLKVIQHNISFRELNQMVFELGSVFEPDGIPLTELPAEKLKLALAVTGLLPDPNWIIPPKEVDFYTLKGTLQTLLTRLQIDRVEFSPTVMSFTHPTRTALIKTNGEELGFVGQLHPDIANELDINQAVIIAEIDFSVLYEHAIIVPGVTPLPRYPVAVRDIAVVIPREVPSLQVEETIKEAGGKLVKGIKLFDLYEGQQIPEGKRSLAYSITYRSEEGTLTDTEVNEAQQEIESALLALGAVMRS